MPDQSFFGSALEAAVKAGTVPQSRVDDMVLRILTALYTIGEFDHPVSGKITNDVTSTQHDQLTRQLASSSTVLLKNNNNLLPLPKTGLKVVSVFNAPASTRVISGGGGSGSVVPKYQISVLTGITAVLNQTGSVNITFYGGSSTAQAAALAKASDVAICVMATTSSEGSDRPNLSLPTDQMSICNAVGKAQPKTVAVVITPGAILTDWADNVEAVLVAFMPGQEEGHAIADILFGTVNPSAKLPVTFPNKENEVGFKADEYPGVNLQEYYREQLNVGYRWYATHQIKPRFAFGFGLSYTTFSLTNLAISGRTVRVSLQNTGKVAGAEVVQLYLGFPASAGEPPIQLKGFQKVNLTPGSTQVLTFQLNDKSLSIWDVGTHSWKVQSGTFTVYVGTSSEDLPLKQTVTFT
jgi:beta-glucosidase